jgi:hypothetical protein
MGMWVFYPISEHHIIGFHLKNGYLSLKFGFVVLAFAKTTSKGV